MKKSLPNNHFDKLLRDRYEKHTIPPEKELWKNINSKVNQEKLNEYLRRIQRLRIAASILAFALIGSFIFYVTDLNKQNNPKTDSNKPGLSTDTIPEKPLNPVHNVVLSDQEQEEQEQEEEEEEDIPETDSYSKNDESDIILSK